VVQHLSDPISGCGFYRSTDVENSLDNLDVEKSVFIDEGALLERTLPKSDRISTASRLPFF
jgi:hypothetical protein